MPEGQQPAPKTDHTLYIVGGGFVIVVFIGVLIWLFIATRQTPQPAPAPSRHASDQIAQPQAQTSAAQTQIPATSNPVKDATPAINPVQAANPFATSSNTTSTNSSNNGYQNPFQ